MNSFEAKVTGIAELKKALYAYNAKLGQRVTQMALRQGANYMTKKIRAAAPVKTGRLKRAIKVKNSRINRINKNGKVGLFVTIYPGKNRKDERGAWYGQFVEKGYNTGKRMNGDQAIESGHINKLRLYKDLGKQYNKTGKVKSARQMRYTKRGGVSIPGKRFLLNTFEANKQQAAELVVQASEIAASRIAKELGFKTT